MFRRLVGRKGLFVIVAALFAAEALLVPKAHAAGGEAHGLNPFVLLALALILVVAKLGGELFTKFNQPAVLGELVGGMAVGGLALFGAGWIDAIRTDTVVSALAEIGVIILLFEVGLESNIREMMEVGWSALLVAVLGVIAPFFLGWGVAAYFIPEEPRLAHIFIGATLCATSVGITARVLKDMGRLQTRESRIVLGAAVIDDVLGLLILAVVAGAIRASTAGGQLSVAEVLVIAAKSLAFLVAAVVAGLFLVPHLFRGAGQLKGRGVLLTFAVVLCFFLAWAAGMVGLAPIIGAFAAGLVLEDSHFEPFRRRGEETLHHMLTPVSLLLVPVFFVLMGLKVDLSVFGRVEVLGFAAVLTAAAIVGKQVCSLGVLESGVNRLAVGLGMIPRGEVGLIFAGIGVTLMLRAPDGSMQPVINAATFGAVVIMVIVTTLVTPPILKWSLQRAPSAPEEVALSDEAEARAEMTERTTGGESPASKTETVRKG